METFDETDIDPNPAVRCLKAVNGLLMAWPLVEAEITIWLASLLRLPADEAFIFLGKMDGKMKLERIRDLSTARGETIESNNAANFLKIYNDYSELRNLIAHAPMIGGSLSKGPGLYFAPLKTWKTSAEDRSQVRWAPQGELEKVQEWAFRVSDQMKGLREAPPQEARGQRPSG